MCIRDSTNSAYLAEKCAQLGLTLYYQTVVGDNEERMRSTIKTALDLSLIHIFSVRRFKMLQTKCIAALTEKYSDFYFELLPEIEFDIEELNEILSK